MSQPPVKHIRIVTYNVHGAVGLDRRRLPSRQLDLLRRLDADCIALQEFVNYPVAAGGHLLEHWCHSLGMDGRFAPCFVRGGQEFGNAVLSRFPVKESREHDMSAPGAHRRVALELSLDTGAATLNLMTVHCAVRPRARALQQVMITALVGKAEEDVRVLLGDFNEWHVWNPTFRALREHFAVGPTLATFPAVAPALALDRIWVSPPARLLSTQVESRPPAPYASDHLPVLATVAL